MERYTMFLDWKNQYCENDYTTQSNLQVQGNPYEITNGIFYGTRTKSLKICMETQKTPNMAFACHGPLAGEVPPVRTLSSQVRGCLQNSPFLKNGRSATVSPSDSVGPALHHTCRVPYSGRETNLLKLTMCQALCTGNLSKGISFAPPRVLGRLIRLSQL